MLKWLFTFGVALVVALMAMKGQAAELTVSVKGLRNDEGMLRMALFDAAREFPRGEEIASRDVPAVKGQVSVVFSDMTPGDYAIAIHHDENANQEMDTFLGFPLEGFGFSRDAKVAAFKPPPFKQASFKVGSDDLTTSLRVVYWVSP